jgi:hypothetical protein
MPSPATTAPSPVALATKKKSQENYPAPGAPAKTDAALMSNAVAEADATAKKDAVPTSEPAQPKCDVVACSKAYHSFQASDCTYQPSNGPRRLCTKGVMPNHAVATSKAGATNSASNKQCNIDACSAAYRSFDASDCSYQPSSGPRRLCAK